MSDVVGSVRQAPLPIFGVDSNRGIDSTPPGYTPSATGVFYDGKGITRAKGRTKLNSSAAFSGGKITAGFDFQTPDGRLEVVCGNGFIAKVVNGTFTNLATGRTVNAIERGDVFMGNLILTNGYDVPLALTVGGGVTSLSMPYSKYGILYNNHFFAGHQPDGSNGPSVIQNSALRDFTTFNILNAYNIESNNADVVRGFFKLGGYLGVAKEDSITFLRGTFFDQTSNQFDAFILPPYTGGGVLCPNIVNDRYGRAVYYNETGFWRHDSVDKQPTLLSNAIRPDIIRISVSRAEEMSIVSVPNIQEIWMSVPVGSAYEFWRYIYRPDCLKDGIGAWWKMPWTNMSALWTFEASLDLPIPRGGSTDGFAYKLDDSWSDNGSAYDSRVMLANNRGGTDGYSFWEWAFVTFENVGTSLTMRCFPDGMTQSPYSITADPDDATNRLTVERALPIFGRSRRMNLEFENLNANQPWGIREMRLMSHPGGHTD